MGEQLNEGVQQQPKLTFELTDKELEQYDELAGQYCREISGCSKVHVVVQVDPDNFHRRACYLMEPNYLTKIRVMDKATTIGAYSAADELRVACTLKEKSHPLTYGEGPESDRYKLGIVDYCLGMVRRLENQFKKKSPTSKLPTIAPLH